MVSGGRGYDTGHEFAQGKGMKRVEYAALEDHLAVRGESETK